MIGVLSLLLLVMWVLFIFSVHSESSIFTYIGSCGLILLSVYMMINGIEGIDNFVTKGVAVIQIGIGFIGLFAPLFDSIDS